MFEERESEVESVSHLVLSQSLRLHGLEPASFLCPGDSPGKNTGVGCHFLLQGIFPTQGSNPCVLHCRWTLCPLSHQGSKCRSSGIFHGDSLLEKWMLCVSERITKSWRLWVAQCSGLGGCFPARLWSGFQIRRNGHCSAWKGNCLHTTNQRVSYQWTLARSLCQQLNSSNKGFYLLPLWQLLTFNTPWGELRLETEACCAPGNCWNRSLLFLFGHSVVPHSLWPHGQQHARLPSASPSPGACSNSCPLSHWCHPSHPLSSPSPPDFNLSQHQGLFQWVGSSHQAVIILELQLQHQSFQWTFWVDFL